MAETPIANRIPIHAADPQEVFDLEASLLREYGEAVDVAVTDIMQVFNCPKRRMVAATSYVEHVGAEIPDPTIRAAVRRLATSRFRAADPAGWQCVATP